MFYSYLLIKNNLYALDLSQICSYRKRMIKSYESIAFFIFPWPKILVTEISESYYLTRIRGVSIDLSVFRFIAEEWSPCSVTCGEGVKHREVRCKIFLEFSQTIAKLPDSQCSGPKPVETEKCTMEPCGLLENSLPYRIDTVGDSGYAESSLTDSYSRSSSGSSGGSGYDSGIKVAPGGDVQTTYSWKETGYTPCSATCLGGNGLDDHCSPRLLLIIYPNVLDG